MYLMLREGSSEKNLEALLPAVTDDTCHRCMFVVDDRTAADLAREGDIDHVVRRAMELGMEPIRAIQLATCNPAHYFRLFDRGAIAAGKVAHLLTVTDLRSLEIDRVYHRGVLVAQGGKPLFSCTPEPSELTDTVRLGPLTVESLRIPRRRDGFPVIELVPGQIVTRKRIMEPAVEGEALVSDTTRDILKVIVAERHRGTGNIGRGFVTGFGLLRGAIASSVGHDSHNIITVGVNDQDIAFAVQELIEQDGGIILVKGRQVLERMPMPIAGLMSDQSGEWVDQRLTRIHDIAREELGISREVEPIMTLCFMSLSVIPEIKLTDMGLFDVTQFRFIPIEA
jgi:adenine deaminase